MAFADYSTLIEPLVLPINGTEYTIPGVSYDNGLTLQLLLAGERKGMSNDEFYTILLGDQYARMRADGVPAGAIHRAAYTALADFHSGRTVAEQMWREGVKTAPKALTTPDQTATETPSPSTGAASTTRKRASTSGTTSKKPRTR